MPENTFAENSLSWQWQQSMRQLGEWMEWKWNQFRPKSPQAPATSSEFNSDLLLAIARGLFWIIFASLVIWLGWRLWCWWRRYGNPFLLLFSQPTITAKLSEPELNVTAWLKQAQEFQKQENYREACRCLYMAMLQRLNDKNIIPHKISRTDGEYRELLQKIPRSQSYFTLISTHENICFGNADISLQIWQNCQKAYQEIEEKT